MTPLGLIYRLQARKAFKTDMLPSRFSLILSLVLIQVSCGLPYLDQRCLESPTGTLVESKFSFSGYACRRATDHCELGFIQAQHGPEECEAKEGCEFIPGKCYCPPFAQCICGGGPPSVCKAIDRKAT